MSQLKNLTDSELTEKIKSLAREERKLTRTIIEHIAEIDRRKTFLAMAYSSLYEYLTKEVGYSAGAAQRRIDAARLLHQVPEVARKIESGTINLSQISKLQMAARLVRKDGHTVSADTQRFILEKLENKGAEQTDLILAQEFHVPVKIAEKRHVQRDESMRVEMTFTKEEMKLVNRAGEILSHKTGGGLKNTVIEMAARIIKAAEPKVKPPSNAAMAVKKDISTTAAVEVNDMSAKSIVATPTASPTQTPTLMPRPTKTITPRLRREILARDKCCQYRNKTTGKMCGSRHFLEMDHIHPRFASGSNAAENLRILCKNHNIYRYQAEL